MNEELLGNYPDSRYLWGQAAEMDRKSKDAGAKAEFYRELVRNPVALFAAPNSAPKPAKTGHSIIQSTHPENSGQSFPSFGNLPNQLLADAPRPQEFAKTVSPDYQSAADNARLSYREYKAAQKEFDKEYAGLKDPTSASGYDTAYTKLQTLKSQYQTDLMYLLDNADSFDTDLGITPPDRDRETLEKYMEQLTGHMWDYYNENPETANPEKIAMYIADIAAIRTAIRASAEEASLTNAVSNAAKPTGIILQSSPEVTPWDRIKQMGISAGSEMLGSYTQGIATTNQWLAERNLGSTQGYTEQLKLNLQQAIHERNSYLAAGISEDNPLVAQLNITIHSLETNLNYIQSGQFEADRAAGRQDIYDKAADFYEQAETAQNKAAEGLGTVGSFLVGTGIEGCKMLADATVGTVLSRVGVPGGALANRLVRSFGDGAYKAAQMGGGSNMQIAYGVANSMTEYLSSKFDIDNHIYDDVVKKFTRGAAKDLKTNMTIHEIVGSYSLKSLGESLATLGKEIIDPVYECMITNEWNMEKIWHAWDESLEDFVLSFTANVVTHE